MPRAGAAREKPAGRATALVPVGALSALRRQTAAAYLEVLAKALHLQDWEIVLAAEPTEDDNCASITCAPGQKRADVRLAADFFTHDLTWQRQTLVHELIHCHLAHARELVSRTGDALLSQPASTAFFTGVDLSLEYATDALADAIAPLLPFPDWASPAGRRPGSRR